MKKIQISFNLKELLSKPISLISGSILLLLTFPLTLCVFYCQNLELEGLKQKALSLEEVFLKKQENTAPYLIEHASPHFLNNFSKNFPGLSFAAGEEKKTSLFKEMELIQENPIEIEEKELRLILSTLENKTISTDTVKVKGSPQFLFTSFTLEKIENPNTKEKIYSLQMKLLQRQKNT